MRYRAMESQVEMAANTSPAVRPVKRQDDAGLTEIVLPAHADNSRYGMVMPMLAHLSHQAKGRWLTWVTTTPVSKSELADFSFNLKNVQVIRVAPNDKKWIVWEALVNGTSDTVIAEMDSLSASEFEDYEKACQQGGSKGLILRARN